MVVARILFVLLFVGLARAKAQQYSYAAGSDFSTSQYQVHVSVGQVFKSFSTGPLIIDEGIFSVLVELLDLESSTKVDQQIRLYPNPLRDELVIEAPLEPGISGLAEIYSLQGVLVESFTITVPTMRLALGHLIAGSYLLRIRILGRTDYVQKIIKLN
jgi:hypothetical protein